MEFLCHMMLFLCQMKIHCNLNSCRIVAVDCFFHTQTNQFFQYIDYPHRLPRRCPQRHILNMTGWCCHASLTPWHPSNWESKKKNNISMCWSWWFSPPQFSSQNTSSFSLTSSFLPHILSSRVDDRYHSRCFSAVQWSCCGRAENLAR